MPTSINKEIKDITVFKTLFIFTRLFPFFVFDPDYPLLVPLLWQCLDLRYYLLDPEQTPEDRVY